MVASRKQTPPWGNLLGQGIPGLVPAKLPAPPQVPGMPAVPNAVPPTPTLHPITIGPTSVAPLSPPQFPSAPQAPQAPGSGATNPMAGYLASSLMRSLGSKLAGDIDKQINPSSTTTTQEDINKKIYDDFVNAMAKQSEKEQYPELFPSDEAIAKKKHDQENAQRVAEGRPTIEEEAKTAKDKAAAEATKTREAIFQNPEQKYDATYDGVEAFALDYMKNWPALTPDRVQQIYASVQATTPAESNTPKDFWGAIREGLTLGGRHTTDDQGNPAQAWAGAGDTTQSVLPLGATAINQSPTDGLQEGRGVTQGTPNWGAIAYNAAAAKFAQDSDPYDAYSPKDRALVGGAIQDLQTLDPAYIDPTSPYGGDRPVNPYRDNAGQNAWSVEHQPEGLDPAIAAAADASAAVVAAPTKPVGAETFRYGGQDGGKTDAEKAQETVLPMLADVAGRIGLSAMQSAFTRETLSHATQMLSKLPVVGRAFETPTKLLTPSGVAGVGVDIAIGTAAQTEDPIVATAANDFINLLNPIFDPMEKSYERHAMISRIYTTHNAAIMDHIRRTAPDTIFPTMDQYTAAANAVLTPMERYAVAQGNDPFVRDPPAAAFLDELYRRYAQNNPTDASIDKNLNMGLAFAGSGGVISSLGGAWQAFKGGREVRLRAASAAATPPDTWAESRTHPVTGAALSTAEHKHVNDLILKRTDPAQDPGIRQALTDAYGVSDVTRQDDFIKRGDTSAFTAPQDYVHPVTGAPLTDQQRRLLTHLWSQRASNPAYVIQELINPGGFGVTDPAQVRAFLSGDVTLFRPKPVAATPAAAAAPVVAAPAAAAAPAAPGAAAPTAPAAGPTSPVLVHPLTGVPLSDPQQRQLTRLLRDRTDPGKADQIKGGLRSLGVTDPDAVKRFIDTGDVTPFQPKAATPPPAAAPAAGPATPPPAAIAPPAATTAPPAATAPPGAKRWPAPNEPLPNELRSSNAFWNVSGSNKRLDFADPLERALFIVRGTGGSKSDAKWMTWLRTKLPGHTDAEIRSYGDKIRDAIKTDVMSSKANVVKIASQRGAWVVEAPPPAADVPGQGARIPMDLPDTIRQTPVRWPIYSGGKVVGAKLLFFESDVDRALWEHRGDAKILPLSQWLFWLQDHFPTLTTQQFGELHTTLQAKVKPLIMGTPGKEVRIPDQKLMEGEPPPEAGAGATPPGPGPTDRPGGEAPPAAGPEAPPAEEVPPAAPEVGTPIAGTEPGVAGEEPPGAPAPPPVVAETPPPAAPAPPPTGRPLDGAMGSYTKIFGLSDPNKSYEFVYMVVPLDSLITSHNPLLDFQENPEYDQRLQGRRRDATLSKLEAGRKANNFAVNAALRDNALDRGPAIVDPANSMVESGNGRINALRLVRARSPERFAAYHQALLDYLPEVGLRPEEIEGVVDPVLVRARTGTMTDAERIAFAEEANRTSSEGLSLPEQAVIDATHLSRDVVTNLHIADNADIEKVILGNSKLYQNFIDNLTPNERRQVLTQDGKNLTSFGIMRIKNALIALTYSSGDAQKLADALIEGVGEEGVAVKTAFQKNTPAMAKLMVFIEQGRRSALVDPTDELASAVDVLTRLRQHNRRLSEFMPDDWEIPTQETMRKLTLTQLSDQGRPVVFDVDRGFKGTLSPTEARILRWLYNAGKSPTKMRRLLDAYVDAAMDTPDTLMDDMFGTTLGQTIPTKEALFGRILDELEAQDREETKAPLFGGDTPTPPTGGEAPGALGAPEPPGAGPARGPGPGEPDGGVGATPPAPAPPAPGGTPAPPPAATLTAGEAGAPPTMPAVSWKGDPIVFDSPEDQALWHLSEPGGAFRDNPVLVQYLQDRYPDHNFGPGNLRSTGFQRVYWEVGRLAESPERRSARPAQGPTALTLPASDQLRHLYFRFPESPSPISNGDAVKHLKTVKLTPVHAQRVPKFGSPLDKALYVLDNPLDAADKFYALKWLHDNFPEKTDDQLKTAATMLHDLVRSMAPSGKGVTVAIPETGILNWHIPSGTEAVDREIPLFHRLAPERRAFPEGSEAMNKLTAEDPDLIPELTGIKGGGIEMLKKFAASQYPGDMNRTVVKELIQNSVDASRATPGAVTKVELFPDERVVIVKDQGVGMARRTVDKAYIELMSSEKIAGLLKAGGYGSAKLSYMGNSQNFGMRTVHRDPLTGGLTETIFWGNGDDVFNATMKVKTMPFGQMARQLLDQLPEPLRGPWQTDAFGRPKPGTWTYTQISADPVWSVSGGRAYIRDEYLPHHTLTGQSVEFYENDNQISEPRVYDPEAEIADYKHGETSTRGATMVIYGTKKAARQQYATVILLNAGLPQGKQGVSLKSPQNIPRVIKVDVIPKAEAGTPTYPWTPDRRGLTDTDAQAVEKWIQTHLADEAANADRKAAEDAIKAAIPIPHPTRKTTTLKLFDETGQNGVYVQELAGRPYVQAIAHASKDMHDAFMEAAGGPTVTYRPTPRSTFFGLGASKDWLGLNWQGLGGVTTPRIALSPWKTLEEVMSWYNGPTPETDLPPLVAKALTDTMVHEIAHNSAKGHELPFSGALTRMHGQIGHALIAFHAAQLERLLRPIMADARQMVSWQDDMYRLASGERQLGKFSEESVGTGQPDRLSAGRDQGGADPAGVERRLGLHDRHGAPGAGPDAGVPGGLRRGEPAAPAPAVHPTPGAAELPAAGVPPEVVQRLAGVAPGGLMAVTPQQPGQTDEEYARQQQLAMGLMAMGFLGGQDSLVGDGKPFYSALRKTLLEKMPARASVDQIRGILGLKRDAAGKLSATGAKVNEIVWTGLDDQLQAWKDQGVTPTKAMVQEYLDTHAVQVHEVIRGEKPMVNEAANRYWVYHNELEQQYGPQPANWDEWLATMQPEQRQRAQALWNAAKATDLPPPRYPTYVKPGATPGTYRELLLTTHNQPTTRLLWVVRDEDGNIRASGATRENVLMHLQPGRTIAAEQVGVAGTYSAYQSSHWPGTPNIVAHVRFEERLDAQGRKVLHVDELQSDFAQDARSEGFKPTTAELNAQIARETAAEQALLDHNRAPEELPLGTTAQDRDAWLQRFHQRAARRNELIDAHQTEMERTNELQYANPRAVPARAPFIENTEEWAALAMKRMIYWAIDHGYDRITWSEGKVHSDRWGTEQIAWEKAPPITYHAYQDPNGEPFVSESGPEEFPGSTYHGQQPRQVGEFAITPVNQRGGHAGGIDLEGEALRRGLISSNDAYHVSSVEDIMTALESAGFHAPGGRELREKRTMAHRLWKKMQAQEQGVWEPRKEGFRSFYDEILPQLVNKIAKKFGAPVGTTDVGIGNQGRRVPDGLGGLVREGAAADLVVANRGGDGTIGVYDHHTNLWRPDTFPTRAAAQAYIDRYARENQATMPAHSLDITAEMKRSVLGEGFTLFHAGLDADTLRQGVKVIGAHKAPFLLAGAGLLTWQAALQRIQQEQQTGPQDAFANAPLLNKAATFNALGLEPRDLFGGLGLWADNVATPGFEVVAEIADLYPAASAQLLGARSTTAPRSFWDQSVPLAFVGDATAGNTRSIQEWYDHLKARAAQRQQDAPAAFFLASMPFDPLNWMGWDEAMSTGKVVKAINQVEAERAALGVGDQVVSRGLFATSAGALKERNAEEMGQRFHRIAGTSMAQPAAVVDAVDQRLHEGVATADEVKLANILGQRPEVTQAALHDLAKKLGKVDYVGDFDATTMKQVAERVAATKGGTWSDADITWLHGLFDTSEDGNMPHTLTQIDQWRAALGVLGHDGSATARQAMENDPQAIVQWRAALKAVTPEAAEDLARILGKNERGTIDPMRLDRLRNHLGYRGPTGKNQIDSLRQVLGINRRRIHMPASRSAANTWAAKYGLPDLADALNRAETSTFSEYQRWVIDQARRQYPEVKSWASAVLGQYPVGQTVLNAFDRLAPAFGWVPRVQKSIALPLTLLYLASPAWPIHAAQELGLRAFHPQMLAAGARASGRAIKLAATGKLTFSDVRRTMDWWHDLDRVPDVYGAYYNPSVIFGRHGMANLGGGPNAIAQADLPFVGSGFSRGVGSFLRQGTGGPDIATVRAKLAGQAINRQISDLKTLRNEAIRRGATGLRVGTNALATGVEHANIGDFYDVLQHSIGTMDMKARQLYIAREHPKAFEQVLAQLGRTDKDLAAARLTVRRAYARPMGVSDAVWNLVAPLVDQVGHQGKMAQITEELARGKIDRGALARFIFGNFAEQIPYFAQSEMWALFTYATPEELKAYFAVGGPIEQLTNDALTFEHGDRIGNLIDTVTKQAKLYSRPGQREAWKAITENLHKSIQLHRDLWDWAFQMEKYLTREEKPGLFTKVREIRRNLIAAEGEDTRRARDLFWQKVAARQSKAVPMPQALADDLDRIWNDRQAAFAESDNRWDAYWAQYLKTGKHDKQLLNEVRDANEKTWRAYRDGRLDDEERIHGRLIDFYEKYHRGGGGQIPLQVHYPDPPKVVPPQAKADALAAIELIRGHLKDFTTRPTMDAAQQAILRTWAQRADSAVLAVPKDQLDKLQLAHEAAGRLVTENLGKRFVDYLNRTNFDDFMRAVVPFWMYDYQGGNFYRWVMTHVPGAWVDAQQYLAQTQGTGQFPISGPIANVMGDTFNPLQGLWPQHIMTFSKQIANYRPDSVQGVLDQFLKQGLAGFRIAPLVTVGEQLAAGESYKQLDWPALAQIADDANALRGNGILRDDPFATYKINQQLAAAGVDVNKATPQQIAAAQKAFAQKDLPEQILPKFNYKSPDQLLYRKDFQDELMHLGHSKADQKRYLEQNPGTSLWGMLDGEEKRGLFERHPGWKYILDAGEAFDTPEQKAQKIAVGNTVEELTRITNQRKTDQLVIDQRLQAGSISPRQWLAEHAKLSEQTFGARGEVDRTDAAKLLANQTATKVMLPEDKHLFEYYTARETWIAQDVDPITRQVQWDQVDAQTKQFMAALAPQDQDYITRAIRRNWTPTEAHYHQALDELGQYDQLPRWQGISQEQADQRIELEKVYVRLKNADPRAAAAFYAMPSHALLRRRLKPSVQRVQFLLSHADYRLFFGSPSKKTLAALAKQGDNWSDLGALQDVPWRQTEPAGVITDASVQPEDSSSLAAAG